MQFDSAGSRESGGRYGEKTLSVPGCKIKQAGLSGSFDVDLFWKDGELPSTVVCDTVGEPDDSCRRVGLTNVGMAKIFHDHFVWRYDS
jgi:hypothetical protein